MALADPTLNDTDRDTDNSRGDLATSDDPSDPAALSSAETAVTSGLSDDSIPPSALNDLRVGDRVHVNDDPTTYTVQYAYGGILSGFPDTVHLTRDRDGARFALTTRTVERGGAYYVAVALVEPTEIRAGDIEDAETRVVASRLARIGRGDAGRGPGRQVGVLMPSDRGDREGPEEV